MNRNKSMRVTTLCLSLMVAGCLQVNAQKVTFHEGQVSLKQAFEKLEAVSKYKIAYNEAHLDVSKSVVLNQQNQEILDILSELLINTGYTFKKNGNYLVITPIVQTSVQKKKTITGIIKDDFGLPVIGANVVEKGTTNGTITDVDGKYSLEVSENAVLIISYIGYMNKEIHVGNKSVVDASLKEEIGRAHV